MPVSFLSHPLPLFKVKYHLLIYMYLKLFQWSSTIFWDHWKSFDHQCIQKSNPHRIGKHRTVGASSDQR